MILRKFFAFFRSSAAMLIASGVVCASAQAQSLLAAGPLPDAPAPFVEVVSPGVVPPLIVSPVIVSPVIVTPSHRRPEHRFWDTQNRLFFVAAAAFNGADFAVTRANLQSGGQELNPLVQGFGRSTTGLAMNFIGETAGVISLSYFLHKTGHHKLERVVCLVNIGSSAGAVAYGLAHR
jgi:hypothetical protein